MFKISRIVRAGGSELQDRAEFFHLDSTLVLIVADGAGGISGGAAAAEFVVRRLRESVSMLEPTPDELTKSLSAIDREMAVAGALGETTCVVAAVSSSGIVGASVGDSGAWIVSSRGVDNLTGNQSRRPLIGSGEAKPFGFDRAELSGTLLIASDGLLKYTSQERIASAVQSRDLDSGAHELLGLVRYPSGALPDDVSILLARCS